jgi:hypothetical protein
MVVLATKVYVDGDARERALKSLRSQVENHLADLSVTYEVGVRHDDFPTVTIDGDDAVIARNLLAEEWGAVTTDFTAGEEYVGTLEAWDEAGFTLDAGREIEIPTTGLDLGPGDPSQIRTRFGLVQHLPMRFVYDDDQAHRLADGERDRLFEWSRGTGRVNYNSATRGEARATVNRAGHAQDIVTVERCGLLEGSIICRENTDPPGLLAAIGQYLPAELLCVLP